MTTNRLTRRTFVKRAVVAGGAMAGAGALAELLAGKDSTPARAPGPGGRQRAPNILVVIVDQLRAPQWFQAGALVAGLMPNLARLRNGGVSFDSHYTAANDCTPARSTLLTGLYSHQTGCLVTGGSTLAPPFPTWGTMLREHGYTTAWFGKWHLTSHDNKWTVSRNTGRTGAVRILRRHLPVAGRRARAGLARGSDDRRSVQSVVREGAHEPAVVHDRVVREPARHRLVVSLERPRRPGGVGAEPRPRAAGELRDARAADRRTQAAAAALAAADRRERLWARFVHRRERRSSHGCRSWIST